MNGEHLAAVCGLYCGACRLYRAWSDNNQKGLEEIYQRMSSRQQMTRDNLQCDGCLAQGHLTPWCRQCAIRLCPDDKPGVTRCSDCSDFPCSRITTFNNDGMRHHAEVLANLCRQREIGVNEWLREQDKRWRCPHCQAPVDWYAQSCFRCGIPQPDRLPSPPQDKK